MQQTVEVFETKEQVATWFQDQVTFHETWEDYYEEQRTNYTRAPFPLVLVGLEEVHLSDSF